EAGTRTRMPSHGGVGGQRQPPRGDSGPVGRDRTGPGARMRPGAHGRVPRRGGGAGGGGRAAAGPGGDQVGHAPLPEHGQAAGRGGGGTVGGGRGLTPGSGSGPATSSRRPGTACGLPAGLPRKNVRNRLATTGQHLSLEEVAV